MPCGNGLIAKGTLSCLLPKSYLVDSCSYGGHQSSATTRQALPHWPLTLALGFCHRRSCVAQRAWSVRRGAQCVPKWFARFRFGLSIKASTRLFIASLACSLRCRNLTRFGSNNAASKSSRQLLVSYVAMMCRLNMNGLSLRIRSNCQIGRALLR